jgi:hypothetical protein
MWQRGCFPTKTLARPRRFYRMRDRCAVLRTLLRCVCTQRRNCIGQLSLFSEYAPPALRNKWKPAATIKLIHYRRLGAKPHESSANGGYNAQPSAPNRARRFIAHNYRGQRLPRRKAIPDTPRHGNERLRARCRQPAAGWYFVPKDNLVAGDVMLTQKIALETDERGALAVANNFTPR